LDGYSHIKLGRILGNGEFDTNTDSLHSVNSQYYQRGFIKVNGGYAQRITLKMFNPIRYEYGIIKYDTNGVIIYQNMDTTSFGYIYI
jgi:hypothetical protein